MGSLATSKIKDKFGNLLHVEGGLTSSTIAVEDGDGTDSALKLSTSTVEVNGTLNFTSTPSTGSSDNKALLINSSDNVVTRDLGTSAFQPDFGRLIGRPASNLTLTTSHADVTFASIDNTGASNSYQFGTTGDYNTGTNGITEIVSAGVYRISVSLEVVCASGSNQVEVKIDVGGSALCTHLSEDINGRTSMVSFFYTKRLAASDQVKVTAKKTQDIATTITAGSSIEILRLV